MRGLVVGGGQEGGFVVLYPGVACEGGGEEDCLSFGGFLGEFIACVHLEPHAGHDVIHDSDAFDCLLSCVEESCAVVDIHQGVGFRLVGGG